MREGVKNGFFPTPAQSRRNQFENRTAASGSAVERGSIDAAVAIHYQGTRGSLSIAGKGGKGVHEVEGPSTAAIGRQLESDSTANCVRGAELFVTPILRSAVQVARDVECKRRCGSIAVGAVGLSAEAVQGHITPAIPIRGKFAYCAGLVVPRAYSAIDIAVSVGDHAAT